MTKRTEARKYGSAEVRKCGRAKGRKILLMLLFVLSAMITGCTEKEQMYRESRMLMDTFCLITVVSTSEEDAREAIEAGFREIKKLENLLNYFSLSSEISGINRAAGISPVEVSGETFEILKKAIDISKSSHGAFDPTLAPVIKLWDFSRNNSYHVPPYGAAVAGSLKLVGYENVYLDESTGEVFLKKKGMEIDLGGIAKGYAADKATEAIQEEGIHAALVAVAGDIRGFGLSTSGKAWKVGIQNPRPEAESQSPWEDIIATLHLKNMAISTSGDYQRFFIKDGRRYHHILDPETGFPAETDLISASVIAPEGYMSDGLSTAVFVLGAEEGMALIEALGAEGVLVDRDKKVHLTDGLKGRVEILNQAYSF